MIANLKKSLSAILYERTSSPFYGTLIVSWLVWNWKIIYLTFFISEDKIELDKISYISENLSEINNKKIRIGGMVKNQSIIINSDRVIFIVTDFKNEISVSYSGSVPNLFEEGKGVVAEGFLKDRSFLVADKILAKHDENYMPPEVKEALEGK